MAQTVLGFPWFADGVGLHEPNILGSLATLAHSQPSLAQRLLGFPWLADGVTELESQVVGLLVDLARESIPLAERLMGLPWIADGITENELEMIGDIKGIAEINPEMANSVVTIANAVMNIPGEIGELAKSVVGSLYLIRLEDPDLLQQVVRQSWFQDGLTDKEAALIVALPGMVFQEDIFRGLIEGAHVISDTVSLPLAGEVNLYAVSRSPFQQDVLGFLRTGVRVIEDFMDSPWNNPNVILLVEPEWASHLAGIYAGTHMILKNPSPGTYYHELGHYFFTGRMPAWLREGGSEFIETYTLHLTEEYSLQGQQRSLRFGSVQYCATHGASNIQEWNEAPWEKKSRPENGPLAYCEYSLGESFLLGIYESLGHDVVRASLQQLYEVSISGERRMTEDDIYQTFLSNTPPAQQDEFRDLYLCLHGRPIPGYTAPATAIPTQARDALVALYNATNGPGWKNNANWLSEAPIRQWHGVATYCGRVIGLDLRDNNLAGPIPPELGNLSDLELLYLSENQLTGPIPPELGNLSNLELLYLSENQLTGPIPAELGSLSKMGSLHLGHNQLSGKIPPELGNLSDLGLLYLSENQLTGPIPAELGSLTSLTQLELTGNQVTGPIPAELGSLSKLGRLHLGHNQLSGKIPPELGNLSNLTSLGLALNQLTGPIPAELGKLSNLTSLGLALNQLTGPIPAELSRLSSMEYLIVFDNQLTGPIPAELGRLSNLEHLDLSLNQLTGPIPVELSRLSNLTQLLLDHNQLSGKIPPELGNLSNLEWLFLNGNQLTGCVPKELQGVERIDFNLPFC